MRRRLSDRPRGQALVEFALILPVFILMLVGLFDLGRAVYGFNTVSNASREAVRLAIVDQNVANIQAKAIQRASSLGLSASDVTVSFLNPDLSAGAPCDTAPYQLGCVAQVHVVYHYTPATPIIGNLVGTLTIASTTREPIERTYSSP